MGFCDNITRDQEYAKYGVARGRSFQTKSLYAGGGEFTIPADGSLVEHRYRFENDRQRPESASLYSPGRRVHVKDTVIAYHGDILLYGARKEETLELVARFTNGRLEWIRRLEDYPEANRALLIEQGARKVWNRRVFSCQSFVDTHNLCSRLNFGPLVPGHRKYCWAVKADDREQLPTSQTPRLPAAKRTDTWWRAGLQTHPSRIRAPIRVVVRAQRTSQTDRARNATGMLQ
jgi:hypothetical protein